MLRLNGNQQLKRIGTTITSLNQCCEDMRRHVAAAHRENAPVLEDASALMDQKRELDRKKQLLDAFNKHFIVSEEDLQVLTTATEAVDPKFFAVLRRIKQIYKDCQILLGTENQRLGLELMDQSSRNLNSGYQKLYRWIQKEFKTLNLENPRISSIIRRALRALAERPTMFQSCLDSFAEARERVLTDAFYGALTGSANDNNENPMAKPIEFYAHDPLRYVGDMLAWAHSATVSEREALESIFISEGDEIRKGFEAGREAEPWSAAETSTFDGQKALGDLVNRNVAGVARALRQRIEQVLQNHEDTVLLYKIANLLAFYSVTFTKLLGPESSLLTTLTHLSESSLRQFHTITADTVASVQTDLTNPPANLRIPDFLEEALTQLSSLLKSHDSSLTPASSREADFASITTQALDPYLSACEKLAKDLPEPSHSIFLTNCLLATRITLAPYDFTTSRLAALDAEVATATTTLTDYQHAFFLHTSGLHPLLSALAPLDDSPESLRRIPALPQFQPQALSDASQTLDEFLPQALMDAMENLKLLGSRKVAQEVTAEAAERFCEDFEFVEGRLGMVDEMREGERGEGVSLRGGLQRTSGEIRVLLS